MSNTPAVGTQCYIMPAHSYNDAEFAIVVKVSKSGSRITVQQESNGKEYAFTNALREVGSGSSWFYRTLRFDIDAVYKSEKRNKAQRVLMQSFNKLREFRAYTGQHHLPKKVFEEELAKLDALRAIIADQINNLLE